MACELATVQAAACASGIAKVEDKISLLQLAAQSAATWAAAVNPGVDYSLAAIQDRACESGIGKVENEFTLMNLWIQNLCNYI